MVCNNTSFTLYLQNCYKFVSAIKPTDEIRKHMFVVSDFDKMYEKPWTRFGPYLVGMTTGYLLQQYKNKVHMKWVNPCYSCSISIVI